MMKKYPQQPQSKDPKSIFLITACTTSNKNVLSHIYFGILRNSLLVIVHASSKDRQLYDNCLASVSSVLDISVT